MLEDGGRFSCVLNRWQWAEVLFHWTHLVEVRELLVVHGGDSCGPRRWRHGGGETSLLLYTHMHLYDRGRHLTSHHMKFAIQLHLSMYNCDKDALPSEAFKTHRKMYIAVEWRCTVVYFHSVPKVLLCFVAVLTVTDTAKNVLVTQGHCGVRVSATVPVYSVLLSVLQRSTAWKQLATFYVFR